MIILDEPYASVPLLDWMETSAHPVLTNEFTEKLSLIHISEPTRH